MWDVGGGGGVLELFEGCGGWSCVCALKPLKKK